METLVDELLNSLSLVDIAGLVAVFGLAMYGLFGGDDGFDSASDSGDGGD